jgi:hypothetical protein
LHCIHYAFMYIKNSCVRPFPLWGLQCLILQGMFCLLASLWSCLYSLKWIGYLLLGFLIIYFLCKNLTMKWHICPQLPDLKKEQIKINSLSLLHFSTISNSQ